MQTPSWSTVSWRNSDPDSWEDGGLWGNLSNTAWVAKWTWTEEIFTMFHLSTKFRALIYKTIFVAKFIWNCLTRLSDSFSHTLYVYQNKIKPVFPLCRFISLQVAQLSCSDKSIIFATSLKIHLRVFAICFCPKCYKHSSQLAVIRINHTSTADSTYKKLV